MKRKTNVEKLMSYLFGVFYGFPSWDYHSPAYRYWKQYVKRQKTSLKNLKRRAKKIMKK